MMLLGLLLLPFVLGDVAPLYRQAKPVDKDGLRSYIIVFNPEAPVQAQLSIKEPIQKWISNELPSVDPESVQSVYNIGDFFRGFSAFLDPAGLQEVRSHKYVEYVEEDAVVQLDAFTDRQDYGQVRVNQKNRNLNTNNAQYSYANSYPNQNLADTVWNFSSGVQTAFANSGATATVCVVDTGVLSGHQEFNGRVVANISYVTGESTDGNGHGTHCAGSCCGRYRGVAGGVQIAWAKVLSNQGSGTNANVINGVNWCSNRRNNASRTWVISMSLGGGSATAVNDAVNAAASAGSVPVVAAGNENTDACTRSPAGASRAVTIAASDKDDTKASFSNTGTCVDFWAPGVSIHSAWYTSTTAYNTISGTSMATPLVAGLVAYFGQSTGLSRDTAYSELQKYATQGAIRSAPANTRNYLVSTKLS